MASQFGIGQPVRRSEDKRFLTGRGTYVDDINLPRQTHAVVVYSPHAHADIKSIDTSAAKSAPGVLLVLTGEDAQADGLGGYGQALMPEDVGGPPGFRTTRPVLATGRVRHVGERVALVVAETEEQARDAAELIEIDYAPLPATVLAEDAVKDGAPLVWDGAENNVCFPLMMGDADATEKAIASAHYVAKVHIYNNRLTTNPMEMRGTIGDYNRAMDEYTLYTSTQNPHGVRAEVAGHILHMHETKLRVIARDVGGGFGLKGGVFPEDALVVWAAGKLERPVKWVPSRSEAMILDDDGRDQTLDAEMAVDKDGKILAMRWIALNNLGAYVVGPGAVVPMFALGMSQGVYKIPTMLVATKAVFTNTPPTTPYRGAGRPEATYTIERLMDAAARGIGMDPAGIRKKNFIQPGDFPFETHTHQIYDSGDYATALDKCLELSDYANFAKRRAESEKAGKKRGLGLAYYIDNTGIFNDRMELRFDPSGSLTIVAGTFSHGQGHETTYKQIASDLLGVPFEDIKLVQGDTAAVSFGRGTYASRSAHVGGSALKAAAEAVIESGKKFAGMMLEAGESDLEFVDGLYKVTGTDKAIPMTEVAKFAYIPAGPPSELGTGLEGVGNFATTMSSFPNGAHVCEVEIDPDTGKVVIDRFFAVDDMGNIINPLLVAGQIHGGIVQGVGQALLEDMVYDRESGQLLSGSFLDYAMPRADDVPSFQIGMSEVPSPSNPLGVKGAGEGGTVGATPTVINAIVDALESAGITNMELPATPERVWRALSKAA